MATRTIFTQELTPEFTVDPRRAVDKPRNLPRWFALAAVCNGTLAAGAIAVALTCLAAMGLAKHGQVPTNWRLLFHKQVATGLLDRVQHKVINQRNGLRRQSYIYSYSFQLPDGTVQSGKSVASHNLFPGQSTDRMRNPKPRVVQVEYVPNQPSANRMTGTMADDGQALIFAGIILPVLALGLVTVGIRRAAIAYKLLRNGTFAEAFVTHCGSGNMLKNRLMDDVGHSAKRRPEAGLSLMAFQQKIWAAHRSEFDASGKFVGTPWMRKLHIAMAGLSGLLLLAILSSMASALVLGRLNPRIVLGSALCGAGLMAAVEWRSKCWMRSNIKKKIDDRPGAFRGVPCSLQCLPTSSTEVLRFERSLDLNGDETDGQPRWIIYLPDHPRTVRLLSELELELCSHSQSELRLKSPLFGWRLAAMLLAPVIAIAGMLVI